MYIRLFTVYVGQSTQNIETWSYLLGYDTIINGIKHCFATALYVPKQQGTANAWHCTDSVALIEQQQTRELKMYKDKYCIPIEMH